MLCIFLCVRFSVRVSVRVLLHVCVVCAHVCAGLCALCVGARAAGRARSQVALLAPKLFLGLPGLVLLRLLVRSNGLQDGDQSGGGPSILLLTDGSIMTDENRPRNPLFDRCFEALLELKRDLKEVGISGRSATDIRLRYLEQFIVSVGRPTDASVEASVLAEDQKVLLGRIAARVQSYATTLSQLPTFKSRFAEVCSALQESEVFREREDTDEAILEEPLLRRERANTAFV